MSKVYTTISENFAVDEALKFRKTTDLSFENGNKDFELDFSKCTFIDSTGLGVLVSLYKKCKNLGGTVKIHSLNPQVMKIFKLTRLDKVFTIEP